MNDNEAWQQVDLTTLHKDVLSFTRIQLGTGFDEDAQDIAQEVMLAAYQHREQFSGRAMLKTWVFSIVKNKVIDHLRQKKRRDVVFVTAPEEMEMDVLFEAQFDSSGHWHKDAIDERWPTPEESLEQEAFYDVLQVCLYNLPTNTARVFMMNQILGLDATEVQSQCGLSASNYYTVMHRAREGLRQCLQLRWFDDAK